MVYGRVHYPEAFIDESSSEEDGDTFSIVATPSTDRRLPLKESLGYRGLFGVIGGSLWILGIFGFLTFLWFGHGTAPEAANATSLWRFIALHNYFPQTITICCVALRVAVGIQAIICTSMIAAIMLEKYGAQRRQVAWLSIMRGINDGPLKLGWLLLFERPRAVFLQIESWLTVFVIIVTLALQFSSTLLLLDMNKFVILGGLNKTELGDVLLQKNDDFDLFFLGVEFLTQPPVFATFGEVQAGFDATPNENGLSDTGLVQRSLLPIPGPDARVSVRKAEGTTIVMNSRSSCIRPQISAKYTNYSSHISYVSVYGLIEGTVDYAASFEGAGVPSNGLCSDKGCESVGFDCPIPSKIGDTTGWQTAICVLDGVVGRGGPSNLHPIWNPVDGPWSRNATVVLVITTNMDYRDWTDVNGTTTLPAGKPYQEWQSYDTGPGHFFNITLCSSGFSLGRFHTSVVAPRPLYEPQNKLDLTSPQYSTTDVQAFMGVKRPQGSHSDRKILDLKILGAPEDPLGSSSPASAPVYVDFFGGNLTVGMLTSILIESVMYYQLSPGYTANQSVLICYFCFGHGYTVNPETSTLFSDIVAETGRAANALLTLTTIIFSSVYYTYLGSLRVPSATSVVATTVVVTPGPCSINGCPGFITVVTLGLLHVFCVVIITALYAARVQYSRSGNVWHTIAQLRGDGLADVLEDAHDARDVEVERSIKLQYESQPLKLSRKRANGRVEVNSG